MCCFEVIAVQLNQKFLRQWLDVIIDFGVAKDNADLMQNAFELFLIENIIPILNSFALLIGDSGLSGQSKDILSDFAQVAKLNDDLNRGKCYSSIINFFSLRLWSKDIEENLRPISSDRLDKYALKLSELILDRLLKSHLKTTDHAFLLVACQEFS